MKKRAARILFATAILSAGATLAVMQAKFKDIPASHWATEAVNYVSEKGLIQGYPDGSFKGNRNITRYETAAIFYRLLKSGALNNMSDQGIADLKKELAALNTRQADSDKNASAAMARVSELEAQIKNMSNSTTTNNTTVVNNSELEARVKALEGMLAGYKDHEARILALEASQKASADYEARIKSLEGSVTDLTTKLNAKPVVIEQPVQPVQPVVVDPVKPVVQPTALNRAGLFGLGGNIFLGGGVAATAYPLPTNFNVSTDLGGFLQFGIKNLIGPIGLRAIYDGSPLPSAGLELMFASNGLFAPYVAAGAGIKFAGNTQNYYVGGAIGANINFTSGIGLFLEGAPQYNLTTNAFGVKARAGLNFSF